MYSLVYELYFILKRKAKNRHLLGKVPAGTHRKLLDYCEWFYNIPWARWNEKYPSQKSGVASKQREQKIIISLTTYPKRIGTIWLTIESLLRQSVKPNAVILWLARSQFPHEIADLPENLLRMQSRGLKIRFCDDLRSHKKYYFALQEYPNDLVILADDDMFYPKDTVRKLLKMHKKHPNDICCMTAQVIEPEFTAVPSLWRNPHLYENLEHSDRIQAYTGSGTLIPPDTLHPDVFDREALQRLCFHADDLWIAFMAHRKGTRITTLKKWRPFPISIYGTTDGSLYYINGEGKQNDVQWQNLLENYEI